MDRLSGLQAGGSPKSLSLQRGANKQVIMMQQIGELQTELDVMKGRYKRARKRGRDFKKMGGLLKQKLDESNASLEAATAECHRLHELTDELEGAIRDHKSSSLVRNEQLRDLDSLKERLAAVLLEKDALSERCREFRERQHEVAAELESVREERRVALQKLEAENERAEATSGSVRELKKVNENIRSELKQSREMLAQYQRESLVASRSPRAARRLRPGATIIDKEVVSEVQKQTAVLAATFQRWRRNALSEIGAVRQAMTHTISEVVEKVHDSSEVLPTPEAPPAAAAVSVPVDTTPSGPSEEDLRRLMEEKALLAGANADLQRSLEKAQTDLATSQCALESRLSEYGLEKAGMEESHLARMEALRVESEEWKRKLEAVSLELRQQRDKPTAACQPLVVVKADAPVVAAEVETVQVVAAATPEASMSVPLPAPLVDGPSKAVGQGDESADAAALALEEAIAARFAAESESQALRARISLAEKEAEIAKREEQQLSARLAELIDEKEALGKGAAALQVRVDHLNVELGAVRTALEEEKATVAKLVAMAKQKAKDLEEIVHDHPLLRNEKTMSIGKRPPGSVASLNVRSAEIEDFHIAVDEEDPFCNCCGLTAAADPFGCFAVERSLLFRDEGCCIAFLRLLAILLTFPLMLFPPIAVLFWNFLAGYSRRDSCCDILRCCGRCTNHRKVIGAALCTSFLYLPGVLYAITHWITLLGVLSPCAATCCRQKQSGYDRV